MTTIRVGAIDLGYGSIKCAGRTVTVENGRVSEIGRVSEGEFLSRAVSMDAGRRRVSLGLKMAKNPIVEFEFPGSEGAVYKYRIDPESPPSLSRSSRQFFWEYTEIYALICYALSMIARPQETNMAVIYGVPAGWLDVYKKSQPRGMPNRFVFSVAQSEDTPLRKYELAVQARIGGQTIGGASFILSNFPFKEQLRDRWAIIDIGYGTTDVVVMQDKNPLVIPASIDYGISNEVAIQRLESGRSSEKELDSNACLRMINRATAEILLVARAYTVNKFFLVGGGGEVIAQAIERGWGTQLNRDVSFCDWKRGFGDKEIQVIIPPRPRMVNCLGLLDMLCAQVPKIIK